MRKKTMDEKLAAISHELLKEEIKEEKPLEKRPL